MGDAEARPTDESARAEAFELNVKFSGPPTALGLRDLVQWTTRQGLYFPSGETVKRLPIGCYRFIPTDSGIAFEPIDIHADELIEFPNGPCNRVLSGIENFWKRRHEFAKRGHLFKRGVLLSGPAGSGKTSIVLMLGKQVMRRGGIVTVTENGSIALAGLALLRKVEPERPIVNINEDIEELLNNEGERHMLSLLDGQAQVDNIVHVATTNFPERLGARIIKRPSRFDELVEVELPDEDARKLYFERLLIPQDLKKIKLESWVEATDGMSFAFLRELHVAVFCLGCSFDEVIDRLRDMLHKPDPIEEYPRARIGMVKDPVIRKLQPGVAGGR